METITRLFTILAICLVLVHDQTAAEELKGKELVEKVCKQTPTEDLCVKVLSSDPASAHAGLAGLELIALKVALANASGILTDCKTMIDDYNNLNPRIQQGLADCKQTLLDAEDQLEDTVAALLTNEKQDAQIWLKAALAAIDTCDASIPGDDDILSQKSVAFRSLCNIAVAINKDLDGEIAV